MVRSAKHRLHATRTHTQTDTLNTYWHTDHQDLLGVDGPLGKAQVTRYTHTHTDGHTQHIRCAQPHGLELLAGTTSAHSRTMSPLDRA